MLAVGHYTRIMFGVARVGFEPTASLVLSQSGLPVAYRAMHGIRVEHQGIEP